MSCRQLSSSSAEKYTGKTSAFSAFNSCARASFLSRAKSAMTTAPPSEVMRRTVASPMPEAAPVTMAILFLNLCMSVFSCV